MSSLWLTDVTALSVLATAQYGGYYGASELAIDILPISMPKLIPAPKFAPKFAPEFAPKTAPAPKTCHCVKDLLFYFFF